MELEKLIKAFKTYIEITKTTGDLSDVDPKDIADGSMRSSYSMPKCTRQQKQKFDQAKQEVENILNSYIDTRVKTVIQSMNDSNLF